MINEKATSIAAGLAKSFISVISGIDPEWHKGYLRVYVGDGVSEAKASYVRQSGVEIIDVLKHKEFFHAAPAKGRDLLAALEKSSGLFVLVVDASFDYEIKFEYKNMNKWRISKLKDGSGIPEGFKS